ncbi:MAG: chorismate mutase [Candidatus Methanoperedens sp.]|nr:chorismate mutase [Candidatus Methanoperedens sp.]MCZ7361697.1 chorismate mutase [Candidatus Methanoperedens sp.]HLB71881.1 chorismate mutase [Candidatus Methanoperedens sp.]
MPLKEVRAKIEKLDIQILNLIEQRTALAKDVLEAKKAEGKLINDEDQNRVVLDRVLNAATEKGLDGESVKRVFDILIKMNIERQHELSGEGNLP